MNQDVNAASNAPALTPLLNTVGKRIRALRVARNWSQLDLVGALRSQGVEVGNSFISQVESGEKRPSVNMLVALAKVLGTTTDFLLMLSNEYANEPAGAQDAIA